jgi:two-component system LytT family response regulator
VTIRAVVVDDEPLARRGVRLRLERAGDVEVVRECASGREAVAAIRELAPDLVFLDVQMPGVDGFGVVEQVGAEAMPPVVFVTAYDGHALRAFEAQALDYVLKPIDDERFARTLERAKRRVAERHESSVGRRVAALLRDLGRGEAAVSTPPAAPAAGRLVVRERGRVLFVDADDVDWIEAEGDYVRLHLAGRSHLLRGTMAEMERALGAGRFVRTHRSVLVNVSRVAELRAVTSRECVVLLHGGARLRVSRRYRDRLEARLRQVR